jgi:hypothetical protein
MPGTQKFASGLVVRQDFAEAVRPVFFLTDHDEFVYGTHGGTLFIVMFRGCVYGVTCHHVFRDFSPGRLFVTQQKYAKKGSMPAHVTRLAYPSSPKDSATDTDVTDLCVIEFSEDTQPDFFSNPYLIEAGTIATSRPGDELCVAGVLKELTILVPGNLNIGYCRLVFQDAGPSKNDPVLRRGEAEFANPTFTSIIGISGSPVHNRTLDALCGMVVRGSLSHSRCSIYYLDISDIVRLLEAVSTGADNAYYIKQVLHPISAR